MTISVDLVQGISGGCASGVGEHLGFPAAAAKASRCAHEATISGIALTPFGPCHLAAVCTACASADVLLQSREGWVPWLN
jgi:hypothetical protein